MLDTISLTIEFGGGIELLTAPPQPKRHTIQLPARVTSTEPADATTVTPAVTAPSGALPSSDAPSTPPTMSYLIHWILTNLIVERPELFTDPAAPTTVRPGILVLINDADWELEGEGAYELEDGDHISFISTLHGG